MINLDKNVKIEMAKNVGMAMMLAAETAPKGKGRNTLKMALLLPDEFEDIIKEMRKISEEHEMKFFLRDANNLEESHALLIIGTEYSQMGLHHCSYCGFKDCDENAKFETAPCAFNNIDLGIAIGSAVSTAAMHKVDTRVMFTDGRAALDLKLLGENIKNVHGIPISIGPKNIYVDRKRK